MQCQCGGVLTSSEHSVKTMKGSLEWVDSAEDIQLPIRVDKYTCNGCTRCGYRVYDKNKTLLKSHNL